MGSAVNFHVESGILHDITRYFDKSLAVVQNDVLRSTFGPQDEKARATLRGLHNEVFHNLQSVENIRSIKSKWMKYTGYERRNAYKIICGKNCKQGSF
jgi:hypothetical protein